MERNFSLGKEHLYWKGTTFLERDNSLEKEHLSWKGTTVLERDNSLEKEQFSWRMGFMISLTLPTEVQSPRVKGDGRYDELIIGISI